MMKYKLHKSFFLSAGLSIIYFHDLPQYVLFHCHPPRPSWCRLPSCRQYRIYQTRPILGYDPQLSPWSSRCPRSSSHGRHHRPPTGLETTGTNDNTDQTITPSHLLIDTLSVIPALKHKCCMYWTKKKFRWIRQKFVKVLTRWGRVTHICVGKLTIIGSDNGSSPGRRQAIIWTNTGILLIGPLATNFNEILIEIHAF